MFVLAASADSSMMLDATIFLGAAVILIPLAKRFGIATVLVKKKVSALKP